MQGRKIAFDTAGLMYSAIQQITKIERVALVKAPEQRDILCDLGWRVPGEQPLI